MVSSDFSFCQDRSCLEGLEPGTRCYRDRYRDSCGTVLVVAEVETAPERGAQAGAQHNARSHVLCTIMLDIAAQLRQEDKPLGVLGLVALVLLLHRLLQSCIPPYCLQVTYYKRHQLSRHLGPAAAVTAFGTAGLHAPSPPQPRTMPSDGSCCPVSTWGAPNGRLARRDKRQQTTWHGGGHAVCCFLEQGSLHLSNMRCLRVAKGGESRAREPPLQISDGTEGGRLKISPLTVSLLQQGVKCTAVFFLALLVLEGFGLGQFDLLFGIAGKTS